MDEDGLNRFTFLAFGERSELILAHSGTAEGALAAGDEKAPDEPIYIMYAAASGWKIWAHRLSLTAAREVLNPGLLLLRQFWRSQRDRR